MKDAIEEDTAMLRKLSMFGLLKVSTFDYYRM